MKQKVTTTQNDFMDAVTASMHDFEVNMLKVAEKNGTKIEPLALLGDMMIATAVTKTLYEILFREDEEKECEYCNKRCSGE